MAAGMAEQDSAPGEGDLNVDLLFDLLDALAVETDPRAGRMLELLRERGWGSWTRTRPERLAKVGTDD